MAEPGLIRDYLAELSACLPARIVEELADGLDQTRRHYLEQGEGAGEAARAAIAEFGEPQVVIAAFACGSPGRRAGRRLLAAGPVAGGCWGAALVTGRAWAWPVPSTVRIVFGMVLIIVICLLIAAAFGRKYRAVGLSAGAGCIGIAAIDSAMLIAVALAGTAVAWPVTLAATVSAVRIGFTVRALRSVLTG